MDAWEKAEKLVDKNAGGGGMFLRLVNDGDKIMGAVVGPPFAHEVVWNGNKYVPADSPEAKGAERRATTRVAINLYDLDAKRLGIFEMAGETFQSLLTVRRRSGLERAIEIERHGKRGDTRTKFHIFPARDLTESERSVIEALEPYDLETICAGGPANDNQRREQADDDPLKSLFLRLKALPRMRQDLFLTMFEIDRVSQLPLSKLRAAQELVTTWERADRRDMDEVPF